MVIKLFRVWCYACGVIAVHKPLPPTRELRAVDCYRALPDRCPRCQGYTDGVSS